MSPAKKGDRWITPGVVRTKSPEADLKEQSVKVFRICLAISIVLHGMVAVIWPTFEIQAAQRKQDQIVIQMEDLPETRQIERPPPPPRPAVPIETESADVPDDVTIETTDLDFDEIPVDLPPPPPPGATSGAVEEEEIVEFFSVEQKPKLKKQVSPKYPEVARKAGLEGKVFIRFAVGRDGRVSRVTVMRGQEIFREAAVAAVQQFQFSPAIQNDKPVSVWMTMPISFKLTE
jgi:periplasmic protein TonB